MALGHAISSKVEAAYRRGNLFTKRKQMMADWADYVAGKHNKVIYFASRLGTSITDTDISQPVEPKENHW